MLRGKKTTVDSAIFQKPVFNIEKENTECNGMNFSRLYNLHPDG